MINEKKLNQARFVVDCVGRGRGGTNIFKNLPAALKYFYSYESLPSDSDKRDQFVAKEIFFSLDMVNGKIQVIPIRDFESKEPYYLIHEYKGTYDTYGGTVGGIMCSIKPFKNLTQLVQKGLPDKEGIIAHGIELKFEEDP